MLSAIVHDYFLNRGVPGSADMIPSASEPVLFSVFIIRNSRKKSTGNLYKKYLSLLTGYEDGTRKREKQDGRIHKANRESYRCSEMR